MRVSVFSGISFYFKDVISGAWSIAGSCFTIFPYFFRWGDLRKEVTEGYPDPVSSKTPDDLPPRSRGILFNDIDHCTGCKECERICPSQCILIEEEPAPDSPKKWVSVFDIDLSRCTFCGLCVDACYPGSLIHTRQYEAAAYQLTDLVSSFGRGQLTPEHRAKWDKIRLQNAID